MTAEPLTFTYRNWCGEVSERRAIPQQVYFGATEWHPEPQWLMRAIDVDKGDVRDFAMRDMVGPASASSGNAEPVAQAVREAVVRAVNEELHRQEDSGQMEARGWNSTAIGDVAIEAMSTHAHTPVAWRARYIGERGWSFCSSDSQIDTHEIEEMHPLYLFPPAHPDDFERGAEVMRLLAAMEVIACGGATHLAETILSLPTPKNEG